MRHWTAAGLRVLAWVVLLGCVGALWAQTDRGALSDAEIDEVREARYVPADTILLFVKFLDERTDRIAALYSKPRRPGREEDTRDLLEQFTSICDELADNLDDYGPRHADLRRALPKVLSSADRWVTAIKSPPEDEAYGIARRLALESVNDLRDSASQMSAEQQAWFKAHRAEQKKAEQQQDGVIDIPR